MEYDRFFKHILKFNVDDKLLRVQLNLSSMLSHIRPYRYQMHDGILVYFSLLQNQQKSIIINKLYGKIEIVRVMTFIRVLGMFSCMLGPFYS